MLSVIPPPTLIGSWLDCFVRSFVRLCRAVIQCCRTSTRPSDCFCCSSCTRLTLRTSFQRSLKEKRKRIEEGEFIMTDDDARAKLSAAQVHPISFLSFFSLLRKWRRRRRGRRRRRRRANKLVLRQQQASLFSSLRDKSQMTMTLDLLSGDDNLLLASCSRVHFLRSHLFS